MSAAILHTDKELLFKLSQNDDASFIKIYNRYWSKLYAIAYCRVQSKQAAEDIVQEVMTCLWQRREAVRIENLEAWLSAATRYAVFRQLVKYGNQKIVPISSRPETFYDHGLDSKFLDQMLKEQIHRLPEKCKLVFEYSRNHGLSNKEISGEMGISEKTVEKHITKALHSLRERFKKALLISTEIIFLLW